jgi:hypothetical protein
MPTRHWRHSGGCRATRHSGSWPLDFHHNSLSPPRTDTAASEAERRRAQRQNHLGADARWLHLPAAFTAMKLADSTTKKLVSAYYKIYIDHV